MRTTILLFIISAAIVYGGLLLPQTLLIEEKIKINSSSSHISEYLYDLPKWEKWLYWQEWQETSDTEYIYSQFPKGVGAFMKFKEKGQKMKNEKAELYIQSILNENSSNSDFQKLIKNPKFLREQLRKLGRKKLEIDQLAEDHRIPTDRNRDTVERIKNFDAKLSYQDISELFKDPYFKNEVRVSKTKSGIQVKSIKGISAGTHRNHTKKYDGYHRNFLKDLKKVLESFSL